MFEKKHIFFPVNITNLHWALVVVTPSNKTIQYLDSSHRDGSLYLDIVYRFMKDKWEDEINFEEDDDDMSVDFDSEGWRTINVSQNVPHQGHTVNCGVFISLFADRISLDTGYEELNADVINARGRLYMMSCLCQSLCD